jgi:hypothetical protein
MAISLPSAAVRLRMGEVQVGNVVADEKSRSYVYIS